jgi:hypothetical protein
MATRENVSLASAVFSILLCVACLGVAEPGSEAGRPPTIPPPPPPTKAPQAQKQTQQADQQHHQIQKTAPPEGTNGSPQPSPSGQQSESPDKGDNQAETDGDSAKQESQLGLKIEGKEGLLGDQVTVLTTDTCVEASGGKIFEHGVSISRDDLLKKPGEHILEIRGSKGEKRQVTLKVMQAIESIRFDPSARRAFERHPKDFAAAMTINENDAPYTELQSSKTLLPDLSWKIGTDLFIRDGFLSTPESLVQNNENQRGAVLEVTAHNKKYSLCGSADKTEKWSFTVLANPGNLIVDPVSAVLLPGTALRLKADPQDEKGHHKDDARVVWELPKEDSKYLSIEPSTGVAVTAVANFTASELTKELGNRTFNVTAKWHTENGEDLTATIILKPQLVLNFRPIRVKLEPMDDRTADLLFGKPLRKDFWIMRVRLTNNLQDDSTGKYLGSSILVFSESIEMAVALEKRFENSKHWYSWWGNDEHLAYKQQLQDIDSKDSNPGDTKARDSNPREDTPKESPRYGKSEESFSTTSRPEKCPYKPVSDTKIWKLEQRTYTFPDDQTYFAGRPCSKMGWTPVSSAGDFEGFLDQNPEYQNGLLKQQSRPSNTTIEVNPETMRGSAPRPGGKIAVWEPGDDAGKLICRSDFFYRPYSYEIVLNTNNVEEEWSGRSVTFKIADFIGLTTSVVSSIAIPGKGSDLPTGLDKYRNIFIPGVQKLWKDMADTHRQNLIGMTMKPIEEIPFGAEISKVVFFPKRPFGGVVRGYETRISQVCPYYFHATAAVLGNQSGALVQQQPPPEKEQERH